MPTAHLGIDFGTSHTVAVLNRGGTAVPLLFDSSPILPSAVYADTETPLLVGTDAMNAARMEPARFEPNPKRRIDDGQVLLADKEFAVHELFAAVLGTVRRHCERVLGTMPATVTLTHPAVWGSARRLVLEDAAEAAGFVDARLLPEPVAAAMYFTQELRHEVPRGHGIVVADLGGGTFDASVVTRDDAGFTVLAVDGAENLGGVDIDHGLVDLLGIRFHDHPEWARMLNPTTMADRRARRALYDDVRTAKEQLSRRSRADLPVPLLDIDSHFTREELDQITRPLLERAVRITRAVARSSRLPQEQLGGVLLVGGASRMPLVASMLHAALGTAPVVLEQPELVVAQGATLDGLDASEVSPMHAMSGAAGSHTPVSPAPPHSAPVTAGSIAPPVLTPPVSAPPAPPPESATPQPEPLQRPPATVRTARLLLLLHSAVTAPMWTIFFGYLLADEHNVRGADFHFPAQLFVAFFFAGIPPMFALAPVILCVAAFQFKRRVPAVRLVAFLATAALTVLYAAPTAVVAMGGSPIYTWLLQVLVLLLIPMSAATALVLNTESAKQWFHHTPAVAVARPAFPKEVVIARIAMWIHTGVGVLWAPFLGLGLSLQIYRNTNGQDGVFSTDFFFTM
ncbi:MAG: Hsp70 family protein, partial [Stackebrandtia sp.]